MTDPRRKLALRLLCAVVAAFAASMVLTWMLHDYITTRERMKLFEEVFDDIGAAITERVDRRMIRQAMVARDMIYEMREQAWWSDPDESSRRLRELANELGVDEVCVADASGLLTHSARREEVGALDFRRAEGQARAFAALLDGETELAQPLLPNTLRGERVKYVGVWDPDGGFVQVGGQEASVRNLSRTAITGLTHDRHISGDEGGIYITTAGGTIISHPEPGCEGGQWTTPPADFYWAKRVIEGFPVYIVVPKHTALADRRLLVATSAVLNGVALVLAAILVGLVIAHYVRERLRERSAKDMAMAASIQESAIPRTFPPFPGEPRLDIFADMNTARDVGGDFYDFFSLGPGKVAFLIADVSGKGVSAALFMMRAKAFLKGVSLTGHPLAQVVAEVNDALSQDNGANMFVTAWIGELDLATGVVTYVNAGHNPPIILSPEPDAGGWRTRYLRTKPGLVLGVMSGIKYRSETLTLAPGEAIYLYTDGLTEQPDAKGEMFGEERLESALSGMVSGGTALFEGARSRLLGAMLACVRAHALGVEQADDCTQLLVRFNGPRRTKAFAPTQEGIAAASAWLDEALAGLDGRDTTRLAATLHVILDEICSNVVKFSGASGFELDFEPSADFASVTLTCRDDGVAYDPLSHADPDTTRGAAERPIGGLGIMMVKKMARSVGYRREGMRNCLSVAVDWRP